MSAQEPAAASADSADADAIQVIDFEGKFNPEVKGYLSNCSLKDVGSAYGVVGVLGAQSSGKSTLLNLLFKTPFQVMDAAHGRQQTTQGIWMSVADFPLLVLDVEGTDSSQRGEDHLAFERKSALLTVALCDIVVVNMWEHDVGRQEASNYTLLRTVFEVNLQLRRSTTKTLLLFTLRDRVSTPLDKLSKRLREDVEHIWSISSKPDRWSDATFDSLFDLDFLALPHKVLQPREFEDGVHGLREKFRSGELLKEEYRKTVPADGLGPYLEQIWSEISSCRDVDIPASRTLLASFRCDELSTASVRQFDDAVKPMLEEATSGPVKDMRARLSAAIAAALEAYDTLAVRYDATVYKEKRVGLQATLVQHSEPLFSAHVQRLAALSVTAVQRELRGARMISAEKATALITNNLIGLVRKAKEARVDGADWPIDQLLLDSALDLVSFVLDAAMGASEVLESAHASLWSDLTQRLTDALTSCVLPAIAVLQEAGVASDALGRLALRVAQRGRSRIIQLVRVSTSAVGPRIKSRFDELFHYDDKKVPRRWGARTDIGGIYTTARDGAMKLMDALTNVSLPPVPDLLIQLADSITATELQSAVSAVRTAAEVVASPASADTDAAAAAAAALAAETTDEDEELLVGERRAEVRLQFERDARDALSQAQQMQEAARARNNLGPWWVWGLMLVLGWNEIWYFLSNPLLLLLGVALLTAWFMGGARVWAQYGPTAIMVATRLVGSVVASLQGAGEPPAAAAAAAAAAPSASDNKPKRE